MLDIMPKKIYIVMLLLAVTSWSCQKSSDRAELPTGELTLAMDMPIGVFEVADSASLTKSSEDTFDGYHVKIVRLLSGEYIYLGSWADMPKEMELESGVYTITIESQELEHADYDNSYYYLSSKFAIDAKEQTDLQLQCILSNVMVSVDYSDSFLECYSDYSIEIDNGLGTLSFTPLSVHRSANFSLTDGLDIRFTGYNIQTQCNETFEYNIDNIYSQDRHNLYFDSNDIGVLMEHSIYNNGVAVGH